MLNPTAAPLSPAARFPLEEADRCVLCGLCLPHCPTYRATQDENESPRGRISLMRAAASGALPVSDHLVMHLSRCLGCRACERVCPSGVRYGRLIEAGRALPGIAARTGTLARIGLSMANRPRLLGTLGGLLRLYQKSGLQRLARAAGLRRLRWLARLDAQLPALPKAQSWQTRYPAQGRKRGRVALFLGCVARVVDADTLAATIRLLTRLGFEVVVPKEQACCGALAREAGDANATGRLRAQNIAAFDLPNVDAIVSVASGCGAVLAEYAGEDGAAAGFGARLHDISAFLSGVSLPETLMLAPFAGTVAVQDACSLRNALRAEQHVYRLLERIPGARIVPVPDNHLCCGGAGTYPLREPAMAEQLRAAKFRQLASLQPDLLVSANIGCALHLGAGMRTEGLDIPLLHPVVLFERQLRARPE